MLETHALARILAIEPDARSGEILHRALNAEVRADVVVVSGVDAALDSIARHVPDLILTSTFLPPSDGARLIDQLRRRDDATHTQVITTPHFLDAPADAADEGEAGRILPFSRKRAIGAFHCDPAVLRRQVEEYLEQARALRVAAQDRQQQGLVPLTSLVGGFRPLDRWQSPRPSTSLLLPTARDVRALTATIQMPSDRRRAMRRRAADLAGQWGVRLTPDGDASIVDISRTGILLETSTKLSPGSLIDLEVLGVEDSLAVGARLIRSEAVGAGGGHDVKYRVAAMFSREVDLFSGTVNPVVAAAAAATVHTPRALADLLGRVLANANWASNGASLRAAFEDEIRALVRAKEVRIRAVPMRTAGGCQSLYFNIPSQTETAYGLHIVFERGYRPTSAEFRLLKAAASLAAVILDLAPVEGLASPN